MIIDNTYFEKRDLYIPNNKNIDAQPEGSPSVQSELDDFIDKYERDLLLEALGVNNYNDLTAANLDLNNVANLKWKNLVNGTDYTFDGENYRWDGLKGSGKHSLIACYVFCNNMKVNEETYTTVGTVRNLAKNAILENPIAKYARIWGEFIEMYQGDVKVIEDVYYNDFNGYIKFDQITNNKRGVKASLYQYLCDQNELDETNFPNLNFKFYKPVNRFGI